MITEEEIESLSNEELIELLSSLEGMDEVLEEMEGDNYDENNE